MKKKSRVELLKEAVDIIISMRESEARLQRLVKIISGPISPKFAIQEEERMVKERRERWDIWYRRYGKLFVPETKETLEHFAFMERGQNIIYSLKSTERAFEMAKNTNEEVAQWKKDLLEDEVISEQSKWQEFCRLLTVDEKEELERWGEEEVKKDPSLSDSFLCFGDSIYDEELGKFYCGNDVEEEEDV